LSTLFVSADLGNTRLKLCAWRVHGGSVPELLEQAILVGPEMAAEAALWLAQFPAPLRSGMVSVASTQARSEVLEVLAGAGEVLELEHGLELRCARPESVGLDRLFAARGALAQLGCDCIVVDAGTALTVDAILAEGPGVFLGGAIAPGPGLLARSLAEGAAQLPLVEPHPGSSALGGDTQHAIRAGVGIGFRGAARELALAVAREAGLEAAPVVLTGGARGFLLEPDAVFAVALHENPELVHMGLLAAAGLGLGRA